MIFKGLDKSIEVKEQQLTTSERYVFLTVKWGGTEIKVKRELKYTLFLY